MSNGQNDKLLDLKKRRLQKLKEEQAIKGISTPPEVLIEMEELEAEIQQLKGAGWQESKKGGASKWWIPIVVVLIGLAGVAFVAVWNNPSTPVEPSEEEMQTAEFEYLVRIQNNKGENLPDARVTIEVGGRAPLDTYTDSNGVAVIFIDTSYAGKPGFLIVERDGFHPYRQNIELMMNALPDLIRLETTS